MSKIPVPPFAMVPMQIQQPQLQYEVVSQAPLTDLKCDNCELNFEHGERAIGIYLGVITASHPQTGLPALAANPEGERMHIVHIGCIHEWLGHYYPDETFAWLEGWAEQEPHFCANCGVKLED